MIYIHDVLNQDNHENLSPQTYFPDILRPVYKEWISRTYVAAKLSMTEKLRKLITTKQYSLQYAFSIFIAGHN